MELLEVVLAIAVFTLIAAPVVGLLAMTAKGGNRELHSVNAEDLKRRVANELQVIDGALSWDLTSPISLFATKELDDIAADLAAADRYFAITVRDPEGYTFGTNDYSRLMLLDVRWPVSDPGNAQSQLVLPVVVTRK